MSSDFDFFQHSDSGKPFVRRNKTDHSAFTDFQSSLNKKLESFEKDQLKNSRRENLTVWDQMTPRRWRGASLKDFEDDVQKQVSLTMREQRAPSFFITGNPGSGKTHLAHAIIRRCVGRGRIRPSKTVSIEEKEVLGMAAAGFAGNERFSELINDVEHALILDSVGAEKYTSSGLDMIERLLSHAYRDTVLTVVTSTISRQRWLSNFSAQTDSQMSSMLENVIELKTDDFDQGDDFLESFSKS